VESKSPIIVANAGITDRSWSYTGDMVAVKSRPVFEELVAYHRSVVGEQSLPAMTFFRARRSGRGRKRIFVAKISNIFIARLLHNFTKI